jgi:capsular exopolysaccharide synthesis family protein
LNAFPEQELTLRDLLEIFLRRRRIIYGVFAILFLSALLLCVFSTRRYQATGTIQVEDESSGALNPTSLMGTVPSNSDALTGDINMQTQVSVLQSNALALRTIQSLKLAETRDFRSKANATASMRENNLLAVFHKNLVVKLIPGTRLIEVDYLNPDPELAAVIVNQLVQELVNFTFETRYKATESASESLSKQLAELRIRSERLQAQVAQMQRQTGIYGIGMTDAQGREQAYSAVLDQFQHATSTMNDAAQNRILKQAIYQAADSGDAELLSSLAGNNLTGGAPSGANSLATIENLRAQQATLQGELDQIKVKFGPAYPRRAELQGNISSLQHAILEETNRIAKRARNDYEVADKTWKKARQNYEELKVKADALNDKAIKYMITKQEADDSRTLYEDLLKRLKEAGIVQGLKSDTVTVVDSALAPTKPKKPNVPLYLLLAGSVGLFLGALAALLVDALDDRIHDAGTLDRMNIPVIGLLPNERHETPFRIAPPQSAYSERVRAIRSGLMITSNGTKPKVIVVASAIPNEGKSAFCINLAASFARAGKHVLLMEADMVRPVLWENIEFAGDNGLSLLLTGEGSKPEFTVHPRVPDLYLLPAGPSPSIPSELLESDRMRALVREFRGWFDIVLIDAPPTLLSAGASLLCEQADLTIQVVRRNVSTRTSVKRTHDLLTAHSRQQVGVVLNGVDDSSSAYSNYYGYNASKLHGKEGIYEVA